MPDSESFITRWDREYLFATQSSGDRRIELPEEVVVRENQIIELIDSKRPGFFLLRSGHAALSVVEDGESRVIRLCAEGSLLGYGGWYISGEKQYRLRMSTDGILTFYDFSVFQTLRSKSLPLNALVDEALVGIIILKDQRITSLESVSSKDRVAALLQSLARKFGKPTAHGILIDVNVDRLTMAQLAGTTEVNLSRVLKGLNEIGLVVRKGRKLVIPDLRALRSKS